MKSCVLRGFDYIHMTLCNFYCITSVHDSLISFFFLSSLGKQHSLKGLGGLCFSFFSSSCIYSYMYIYAYVCMYIYITLQEVNTASFSSFPPFSVFLRLWFVLRYSLYEQKSRRPACKYSGSLLDFLLTILYNTHRAQFSGLRYSSESK